LLLNTIAYLCDDEGVMGLRLKAYKIRLLDKVRVREEKLKWQIINVVFPLLLISAFGVGYVYFRRKKYGTNI
jgi:ABC-2 type transport system permease protein